VLSPSIGLVVLAGGFGGLVQFLYSLGDFYLDDSPTGLHWRRGNNHLGTYLFGAASITAVLVGIAGALAVWFVIIAANENKFPVPLKDAKDQLYVLGLSVVAGFGSRQLLPSITATLQAQLDKLHAQDMETQSQMARDKVRVSAISRAQTALASITTPPAARTGAAQGLAALQLPTDRTVALLQGRLYAANALHGRAVDPAIDIDAHWAQAITALTSFLQAKGATRDTDYADALYNRACYECLRNGEENLRLRSTIYANQFALTPKTKRLPGLMRISNVSRTTKRNSGHNSPNWWRREKPDPRAGSTASRFCHSAVSEESRDPLLPRLRSE
jgi:hypothetical protein